MSTDNDTTYRYTDVNGNNLVILASTEHERTVFVGTLGVFVPADQAPAAARAILAAAGCDALVVEGIGALPEVTEGENGDRGAGSGEVFRYARSVTSTQFLRDRAACDIALLRDRLAAEAAPPAPVLRKDVADAVRRAVTGTPLAAGDTATVAAILDRLAALPGLSAETEDSDHPVRVGDWRVVTEAIDGYKGPVGEALRVEKVTSQGSFRVGPTDEARWVGTVNTRPATPGEIATAQAAR